MTHTVTITNEGNISDTFDVELGKSGWNTVLGQATITLAAGASGTVAVTVDVPVDAVSGDSDSVVATATSQGNGKQTAATTLITQAGVVYAVSVSGDRHADRLAGYNGDAHSDDYQRRQRQRHV
ncbi:MAG: hypothetical protein IPL28_06225 [Chloroflexi bacterium]|nr:hypothetical protein [Chloroflexota bacterium]